MEHKQVWEITPNTSVPTGRKVIGSCWVLARKDDGFYQAKCVDKGFSQIPGIKFQENHAPVVSDTTLHLLMVIKTMLKLETGQFDIETAFLYGKLEEDLWMAIPKGYGRYIKENHNKYIYTNTHSQKLTKAIYGLVKTSKIMMEEAVGCKIINNKTNDTVYIHQPKRLKLVKQEFGGLVESPKKFSTPAPSNTMVNCKDKENTLLPVDQQTKYRSEVGMLLYLVKHTWFNIANSVRELSKVADRATMAHLKLLLRCITYVITAENQALKIEPKKLEGWTDVFWMYFVFLWSISILEIKGKQ
jgi:hypothetical protein